MNFGEHFTIDGYGGDEKTLDDRKVVLKVLNELPGLIGMHKITEPKITRAPDNAINDPGGWSGFVLIAESHLSVHTFPKRGFISADIYTCKNGMDTAFIENYFKTSFHLKDVETNLLKRGTLYPDKNIY